MPKDHHDRIPTLKHSDRKESKIYNNIEEVYGNVLLYVWNFSSYLKPCPNVKHVFLYIHVALYQYQYVL